MENFPSVLVRCFIILSIFSGNHRDANNRRASSKYSLQFVGNRREPMNIHRNSCANNDIYDYCLDLSAALRGAMAGAVYSTSPS